MPTITNTFWIAANITLDIQTGEKKQILTLVNHEIDATFFKKADAELYESFVKDRIKDVTWKSEPSMLRGHNLYVIRGVQVQDV